MNEIENRSAEVSKLKYVGSKVPAVVLVVWGVLLLFCVYYLATFMLPEIQKTFMK